MVFFCLLKICSNAYKEDDAEFDAVWAENVFLSETERFAQRQFKPTYPKCSFICTNSIHCTFCLSTNG